MTLHLGLPHAHHRNTEQQHEIREARRMLKERVRNDWEYPPLPAFQAPARGTTEDNVEARIAGFRFHAPSNHDRDALVADLEFEPAEWRERDYSSEEDGEEAEVEVKQGRGNGEVRKTSGSSGDGHHHRHHKKLGSIFKFEGPDSVGHQIEERKLAKRRKRQKALDEEVEWNDGLAHWLARRDAWCCARTADQVQMLERNQSQASTDTTSDASARTSPRTSTSTASSSTPSATASSPSTTPDTTPSYLPPPGATLPTHPSAPPSHVLIPLAPTLLPNHPIRKRISTDLYPEIYSKIIISGRTPSVPINLLVLTRALVQGWKDDGEWPPKQGPVEKSIGRKKGSTGESSLKSGVKAVGRVLRITGTGGQSSEAKERERDKG